MTVAWQGPWWLKPFFGDAPSVFDRVVEVRLIARDVPDVLGNLRYLEKVSFHRCHLSRSQMQDLRTRTSIRTVRLFGNQVGLVPPLEIAGSWAEPGFPLQQPLGEGIGAQAWWSQLPAEVEPQSGACLATYHCPD